VGLQTECIASQTANEQTAIGRRDPATGGWRIAMGHTCNVFSKAVGEMPSIVAKIEDAYHPGR
jgi:hypothetical protein